MPIRRTLLVLLSVLLLLSQQAALAHGISHIQVGDAGRAVAAGGAGVSSKSAQFATADHSDDFCIECLAFAQVTGAAPGVHVDQGCAASCAFEVQCIDCGRVDAGPLLSFQARAPPVTR